MVRTCRGALLLTASFAALIAGNASAVFQEDASDDAEGNITTAGMDGHAVVLILNVTENQAYYFVILSTLILVLVCFTMSNAFKHTKKSDRQSAVAHANVFECGMWGNAQHRNFEGWVDEQLEKERYMRIDCTSMYINRPWAGEKGPELKVPLLESNVEWMNHRPFPDGVKSSSGGQPAVLPMTFGLWRFMYRKKAPGCNKCFMYVILEGLCPAALSILLTMITREMYILRSGEPGHHVGHFVLLVSLYGAVNLIEDRCHYFFVLNRPGASVRHELRQRLQFEFIELQKKSPDMWPPGRCIGVLDRDVHAVVNNIWIAVFAVVKHLTAVLALLFTILWTTDGSKKLQLTMGLMYLLLISGIVANSIAREANIVEMGLRKRDWAFTMWTTASHQVLQTSSGELRLGSSDNLEAATFFGKVAMLYRKRAFHFYFIKMIAQLSTKEMFVLAQTCYMAILGHSLLRRSIWVSDAVGTINAMRSLSAAVGEFYAIYLEMVDGFSSLVIVSQIFNQGAGFQESGEESDTSLMDGSSEKGE